MNQLYKFSSLFVLSLFFIACSSQMQLLEEPKILQEKGPYEHEYTKTIYPETIGKYIRKNVSTLDNKNMDVYAEYQTGSESDPIVTVYIYPADIAYENRLIKEYRDVMSAVISRFGEESDIRHSIIPIEKDGYKTFGFKGMLINEKVSTMALLFECGKYSLKFRITNFSPDTTALNKTAESFLQVFSPTDIIKNQPLESGFSMIMFTPPAGDTLTGSVMTFAAMAKSAWISKNIDSLEIKSGVPSYYLEEQTYSLQAILEVYDAILKKGAQKPGNKYLDGLKSIAEAGFLNEFVYDQYFGLLIVPAGTNLNLNGYAEWKKKSPVRISAIGSPGYTIGLLNSYKEEIKALRESSRK